MCLQKTMRRESNKTPLSVVILTYNEEANIGACIRSMVGWADEIFVVDSPSTDRTVEIAKNLGATIVVHKFEGYVEQRNWALKNLPFKNEWIFFMDADEYPTEELKKEIGARLDGNPKEKGFYINRRFVFFKKWIRYGGYYPAFILRLMRHRFATCEGMKMDEHFVVEGVVGYLKNDLMHEDWRGFHAWIERHRKYARLKAEEYLAGRSEEGPGGNDPEARRRVSKRRAYNKLPLFLRAFLYFSYRFFVKLGFLDGPVGWFFHILHGFWYPFRIDLEIVQLRRNHQ